MRLRQRRISLWLKQAIGREKRGDHFRVYQSAGKYRIMATVVGKFGTATSQPFHAEAR
jgi:hypothetical protein